MDVPSLEQLLEAGLHFGHQTRRWNPKMKGYIFGERNGIHIIDLKKSQQSIKEAMNVVSRIASEGKQVLFVGTKRQAQDVIKREAERISMPYVTERWLGGTITNFSTIRRSMARLEELEKFEQEGPPRTLTKKEIQQLLKERVKLEKVLAGVRHMGELPGLVFVVDCKKERIAVAEANKLGIPVIAIVDTNADPDVITFPIPGNDDAMKSIRLITRLLAKSAEDGAMLYRQKVAETEKKAADEAEKEPAKAPAPEPAAKRPPPKRPVRKVTRKPAEKPAERPEKKTPQKPEPTEKRATARKTDQKKKQPSKPTKEPAPRAEAAKKPPSKDVAKSEAKKPVAEKADSPTEPDSGKSATDKPEAAAKTPEKKPDRKAQTGGKESN
jgi:small subunit ribosomal protein S2